MRLLASLIFVFSVAVAAAPTSAAPFLFDESISGPLSGNRAYPTSLVADIGDNLVRGGKDYNFAGDFFAFAVPASATVSSIIIDLPTSQADFSFAISTALIDWQNPASFVYFGETDGDLMGLNLLTELGIGSLPDGPYWFYVGPDDGPMFDYQMTFSIVPEPATTALVLLGLGAVLCRARRASR